MYSASQSTVMYKTFIFFALILVISVNTANCHSIIETASKDNIRLVKRQSDGGCESGFTPDGHECDPVCPPDQILIGVDCVSKD